MISQTLCYLSMYLQWVTKMLLHLHFELLFYAEHNKNHALLFCMSPFPPIQVANHFRKSVFIEEQHCNRGITHIMLEFSESAKFAKLFPTLFSNEADHANKDLTHGCKHLERNLAQMPSDAISVKTTSGYTSQQGLRSFTFSFFSFFFLDPSSSFFTSSSFFFFFLFFLTGPSSPAWSSWLLFLRFLSLGGEASFKGMSGSPRSNFSRNSLWKSCINGKLMN